MFEPGLEKNIEIVKEIPIECQAKIDDVNGIAIDELDQKQEGNTPSLNPLFSTNVLDICSSIRSWEVRALKLQHDHKAAKMRIPNRYEIY
ncbi:16881_t:CDS:2 [Gigaspora margarita]|uniref:16881_t:CDS:1 n=1 Tax=Gigaspora margarita TaxID=4874 RepID=A0ABN7VL02_GIGMA|nr:16881_t:CDS:2 [Gigaspora margarita]